MARMAPKLSLLPVCKVASSKNNICTTNKNITAIINFRQWHDYYDGIATYYLLCSKYLHSISFPVVYESATLTSNAINKERNGILLQLFKLAVLYFTCLCVWIVWMFIYTLLKQPRCHSIVASYCPNISHHLLQFKNTTLLSPEQFLTGRCG